MRLAVGMATLLLIGTFVLTGTAQQLSATAELQDSNGRTVGRAVFTQSRPGGGVWMQIRADGLTPGIHGVHIHAFGNCTQPAFTSAGGHFNPEGTKHGLEAAVGPHAGDLPNLIATPAGTTRHDVANYRITLGPGPNSLFDADGSALVIHAAPDDNVTDPAGNAGARVACGVIRRG